VRDREKTIETLSKLALRGLTAGAFAATASTAALASPEPTTLLDPLPAWMQDQKYSEIHSCAGLNICKGLGGCAVSAAKLEKLAEQAGVPMEKAGKPHSCAGLNECKGLGGCHVDAAKLAKLKKKLDDAKYSEIHSCAGLNVCKGLGGCAVSAAKLEELAKKAGVPMSKAGKPHSCAGLNECKGLGGCHVDAKKLAKLKAKLEKEQ